MDWFSWLSKTNLEPSLVYEYGLAFARNELQKEDLAYFDHEFLQSMGIIVAKHRIEILKLARKETRGGSDGLWGIRLAMSKTKKLFTKNIGQWSFHKRGSTRLAIPELTPYRLQWSGAPEELNGAKDYQQGNALIRTSKNMMRSGPLDRRVQDKLMVTSRSLSISGPLDGKVQERFGYPSLRPIPRPGDGRTKNRSGFIYRSPTVSGPIDGWRRSPKINHHSMEKNGDGDIGDQSLWSLMFQDLKPT